MQNGTAGKQNAGTGARFVAEVVGLPGLAAIRDAWKGLAARAVEPNVFYDPDFALPAVDGLGHAADIRALLVWRGDGAAGRVLTGLVPFVVRRRWGVPVGVGEAFIHPYAMSSAPLVDREAVAETLGAFLRWLAGDRAAPAAWLFRLLPQDGALHEAFAAQAASASAGLSLHAAYGRAVLDAGDLDAAYLGQAIGSKRQKEYRRQRRRLGDLGAVAVTHAGTAADVRAGVEEFLALEAAGWKGRRGSAAVQSPGIAAMFERIAVGLAADGQMRVDALRLDGRPVAVAVSCGVGDSWWLWKIAYDEAFAAYSPGVLLLLDITEAAIAAGGLRYDSCALPGIPMIERVWRQRRPYADVLVVPARLGAAGRTAVFALESLRRNAEAGAKRALTLIGRR